MGGCSQRQRSQRKPPLGQTKDTILFRLHLQSTHSDLGFPPPSGVRTRVWTSGGQRYPPVVVGAGRGRAEDSGGSRGVGTRGPGDGRPREAEGET